MDSYLNIKMSDLKKRRAWHTASEIAGQPRIWKKTQAIFQEAKENLLPFINHIYNNNNTTIILTGAGTSAFIGKVLEGPIQELSGNPVRAIATTDLVTHPRLYLQAERPTLLVSFARSGNSPESVKAVKLADEICREIYHLVITCNAQGELAGLAHRENTVVFLLPPEADDQSLAMTSSFTSMLLAGLLIAAINKSDFPEQDLTLLGKYAARIFNGYLSPLKEASEMPFERAIFLGSGLFKGIAEESHLKLQELTDGRIICKHDTFLGFRHGPKAVIDEKTLMVFLFSNDAYPQQYEKDLVQAVNEGQKGIYRIGVMEHDMDVDVDLKIILDDKENHIKEALLALVSVLPAQILGFYKSLQLGLNPDNPSASGTITRVVQGVKLYPYNSIQG